MTLLEQEISDLTQLKETANKTYERLMACKKKFEEIRLDAYSPEVFVSDVRAIDATIDYLNLHAEWLQLVMVLEELGEPAIKKMVRSLRGRQLQNIPHVEIHTCRRIGDLVTEVNLALAKFIPLHNEVNDLVRASGALAEPL
jgi:hypothetical protein